jgi:hypothetical protein
MQVRPSNDELKVNVLITETNTEWDNLGEICETTVRQKATLSRNDLA